jgi:hypothetical protein
MFIIRMRTLLVLYTILNTICSSKPNVRVTIVEPRDDRTLHSQQSPISVDRFRFVMTPQGREAMQTITEKLGELFEQEMGITALPSSLIETIHEDIMIAMTRGRPVFVSTNPDGSFTVNSDSIARTIFAAVFAEDNERSDLLINGEEIIELVKENKATLTADAKDTLTRLIRDRMVKSPLSSIVLSRMLPL